MDAIYDCHLHTEFSADSETPVRDQLEKAISLGMKEICITDHHDYGSEFCPDDFTLDIPSYIESLRKIRDEYAGRIRLNIGIELGLQNHVGEYLHDFARTLGKEFDFVLGSSHFVDRMDPYEREYWKHFEILPQLSVFAFLYYRTYSIINISKNMGEAVRCQVHTVHYV